MIGVDLRDFNSRRQTQDFRDAGGPGPPNVLLRDYEDCGRGFPDFFRFFRSRRHLDVAKLRQTQLLQRFIRAAVFWQGAGPALVEQQSQRKQEAGNGNLAPSSGLDVASASDRAQASVHSQHPLYKVFFSASSEYWRPRRRETKTPRYRSASAFQTGQRFAGPTIPWPLPASWFEARR